MENPTENDRKPDNDAGCAVATGSASGAHTPGPWHWQYSPMTNLPIALANEKRDVLLSTGDDESAWAQVNDADMKLIARAPDLLALLRKADVALKHHGGMQYTNTWLARDIDAELAPFAPTERQVIDNLNRAHAAMRGPNVSR